MTTRPQTLSPVDTANRIIRTWCTKLRRKMLSPRKWHRIIQGKLVVSCVRKRRLRNSRGISPIVRSFVLNASNFSLTLSPVASCFRASMNTVRKPEDPVRGAYEWVPDDVERESLPTTRHGAAPAAAELPRSKLSRRIKTGATDIVTDTGIEARTPRATRTNHADATVHALPTDTPCPCTAPPREASTSNSLEPPKPTAITTTVQPLALVLAGADAPTSRGRHNRRAHAATPSPPSRRASATRRPLLALMGRSRRRIPCYTRNRRDMGTGRPGTRIPILAHPALLNQPRMMSPTNIFWSVRLAALLPATIQLRPSFVCYAHLIAIPRDTAPHPSASITRRIRYGCQYFKFKFTIQKPTEKNNSDVVHGARHYL
ncbi:hypothetical protein B0H19DRAFT_1055554 [Mycena capillaripes]|nr:hypothetical protein B0H19DRAFT_1055554 [Mycena capillaripes]